MQQTMFSTQEELKYLRLKNIHTRVHLKDQVGLLSHFFYDTVNDSFDRSVRDMYGFYCCYDSYHIMVALVIFNEVMQINIHQCITVGDKKRFVDPAFKKIK